MLSRWICVPLLMAGLAAPAVAAEVPADEAVRAPDVPAKLAVAEVPANLIREFNDLFGQRRYAEAEVIAQEARELAPESQAAEVMCWKARFARHEARNTEDTVQIHRCVTIIDCEIDVPAIPTDSKSKEPEVPRDWAELVTARRNRVTETEEEARIARQLSRPISLHFTKAPLTEVMKRIATLADVNVVIDDLGLREEGVTNDVPVTIEVDGIMLRSALNLMLKPLNLSYVVEDEVLKISSATRCHGRMVILSYPVSDLVKATDDRPPLVSSLKTLAEHLTLTVAPTTWMDRWIDHNGTGVLRADESTGTLIVRQTAAVHQKLAAELERLRWLREPQYGDPEEQLLEIHQ